MCTKQVAKSFRVLLWTVIEMGCLISHRYKRGMGKMDLKQMKTVCAKGKVSKLF